MKKLPLLLLLLGVIPKLLFCQEVFSLKSCIEYAVENNHLLQKSRLDREKSMMAQREVLGALLPQINGSGGMTYNIQKTTFAMPNFVNSMMPAAMQDPNAPKYMTISMGMDYSANVGASLTQQVLNFSLYNALNITKTTQNLTEIGLEITTNDVIAQTATLFFNIQVLGYAVSQFDESIALMDKTLALLETNRANDLVRQVDVDRVKVAKTNLETQKHTMIQAFEVQKNLLKLQMGFQMNDDIEIDRIDVTAMEEKVDNLSQSYFNITTQLPYQMFMTQQNLLRLQHKSATYETLPVITLGANYSMNYMSDEFFKGETLYDFPVSMISLNLRMPIFSGMSKHSKIEQTKIELNKSEQDKLQLEQSLTMGYKNAKIQLEQNRLSIEAQKQNRKLAEDVFRITESNYNEGLSSLSDVLNASSSLIQSQVNYVEALNSYIKAYIDLKKADGTINDLNF